MRNLAHLPIDKLETLPSFQSRSMHVDTKLNVYKNKEYNYTNWAEKMLSSKIDRIIENSVGKNWDDTYSRIKALTVGLRYEFDIHRNIDWKVITPNWSYRNQRWEHKEYRWGKNRDLMDHIESLKCRYSNSVTHFYYICPKTNILRLVKSRIWPYKKEKSSEFWRRHYKFLSNKKKEKKRDTIPEAVYKMINNREIYKFYTSIKSDYKYRLKVLEKGMQFVPKKTKGNIWDRWEARSHNEEYKKFTNEQLKLESLKDQIEELEKGNFDGYFESAVYLYAQQKECHHFGQL